MRTRHAAMRYMRIPALVLLLSVALGGLLIAAGSQRAQALSPCDVLPFQSLKDVCASGGALNPLNLPAEIGHGIMGGLANFSNDLLSSISGGMAKNTSIDLSTGWFVNQYGLMLGSIGIVAVFMLMLAAGSTAVRSDMSILRKAIFPGVFRASLAFTVLPALVKGLLAAADSLSRVFMNQTAANGQMIMGNLGGSLLKLAAGTGGMGLPVGAIILITVAVGGIFIWLWLMVRQAAVMLTFLVVVLMLAVAVWPKADKWLHRTVVVLIGLIASKPLIAFVLQLGTAQVQAGISNPATNTSALLGGTAFIALAAFSPLALVALFPLHRTAMSGGGNAKASVQHLPPVRAAQSAFDYVKKQQFTNRPPGAKSNGATVAGATVATGGAAVAAEATRRAAAAAKSKAGRSAAQVKSAGNAATGSSSGSGDSGGPSSRTTPKPSSPRRPNQPSSDRQPPGASSGPSAPPTPPAPPAPPPPRRPPQPPKK